jgi:hypothetical protein
MFSNVFTILDWKIVMALWFPWISTPNCPLIWVFHQLTPLIITMGKFLHFENILCLDIVFVVGFVSWFIIAPQHPHIDMAPHIFYYLKSHPSLVIHYKGVVGKLIRHLSCSNSDFVGDVEGQRFTLGFVFSLGSGPISWSCKLAS